MSDVGQTPDDGSELRRAIEWLDHLIAGPVDYPHARTLRAHFAAPDTTAKADDFAYLRWQATVLFNFTPEWEARRVAFRAAQSKTARLVERAKALLRRLFRALREPRR